MSDITKKIESQDDFYDAEALEVSETERHAKWGTNYTKIFKKDEKFYAFDYNVHDGISWEDLPFNVYQVTPREYITVEYVKV